MYIWMGPPSPTNKRSKIEGTNMGKAKILPAARANSSIKSSHDATLSKEKKDMKSKTKPSNKSEDSVSEEHGKDKKNKKSKTKLSKKSEENYASDVMELQNTIACWENMFSSSSTSPEDRAQAWIRLEILGEPLIEKYAWAVPDEKALNICASFAPLIEIGSGRGYWAHLLKQKGVDILAYDKYAYGKEGWCEVFKGDPTVLSTVQVVKKKSKGKDKSKSNTNMSPVSNINVAERTLLLSYPDQGESMATECLEYFEGDTIIHIGELLTRGTGTFSGGIQSPWGRTTGADFQVALSEDFHCVLNYRLPNMPFANDYITVWKRTAWTAGRSEGRGDDDDDEEKEEGEEKDGLEEHDDDDDDDDEKEEEEEDRDCWANIPDDERLPVVNIAAPKYAHLLL